MSATNSSVDILLADDDLDEVFIFEFALKKIAIQFVLRHATDGEQLMRQLRELIPDILFLDIHMPCKNGLNCIAEIRANSRYDHMPVIMYTGARSANDIELTYRRGANFYVEKTDSVEELAVKLQYIFSTDWKTQMVYPEISEYLL